MDDQLDNDLKNRIKEVFDKYEDTSADEGWLLLRKKYPEKAKRIIAAWTYWVPAAALALLFLGILWFKTTPKQQQQVAIVKTQPAQPAVKIPEEKRNSITADSSALQKNSQAIAQNAQKNETSTGTTKRKLTPAARANKVQQEYAFTPLKNTTSTTEKPLVNTSQSITTQVNTMAQAKVQNGDNAPGKTASATATATNSTITPLTPNNEMIAKIDSVSRSPVKSNVNKSAPEAGLLAQQPNKNNGQAFADNSSSYKKQRSPSGNKSVSFAVYTTSYINYAKGSNHQFNIGGGLTSDIKLTNHLLFSTGISVTQNSLNYAAQPPAAASPAASDFANSYAPASLSASRYAYIANTAPPAFRNYSASLVGLDVPLNLKFVIDPQKTGTYLLAGLSSGTYINETYTYSYNNPSLFSANVSQVQDQSTRSSFNGFYFAKTLNMAIGTSYMIGHSRLVIEPFLKYPLEGLGSQQLRFGSSGVNLKFNFNGFKR